MPGQSDEWLDGARCRFCKNKECEKKRYKEFLNDYNKAENKKRKQKREKLGLPTDPATKPEDVRNRHVLVIGENGIGDEILTIGCLRDLIADAGRVTWCCDPKLALLLTRSFPRAAFISSRDCRPSADILLPSWMLIGLYRKTLDRFSWTEDGKSFDPYLRAGGSLKNCLRQRYAVDQRPLVGLAWRSEREGQVVSNKSCDLRDVAAWGEFFAALKDKVRFISLQYGDTADEIACVRWKYGAEIYQDAGVDTWGDVDAVAAQVAAMDYVVSISQAAAHLAGALGVSGWILLQKKPFPHWRAGETICPWYPTLVPKRQKAAGDWGCVLKKVASELCGDIDRDNGRVGIA